MHIALWQLLVPAHLELLTVLAPVQLALAAEHSPAQPGQDVASQLCLVQQVFRFQSASTLLLAPKLYKMKQRLIHSLYLLPAVFLILIWMVAAPSLLEQYGISMLLVAALLSAAVSTWCITLFAHAVKQNKP